jgi:cytochrome c553
MKKITLGWVAGCLFLLSAPLFAADEAAAAEAAPAPGAAVGDTSVGDAEAGKVKSAVCAGCHGMEGEGKEAPVGSPSFPSLAGQVASYFIKSVNDYKNDTRNDAMMGAIAKGLNDVDIANLAAYYTALK